MTSLVTITFNNCTFNANQSTIQISNGSIAIDGSNQLTLANSWTFTQFVVQSHQIQIDNSTGTGAVNGTIAIPVKPPAAGYATIKVNSFSGQASVAWDGDPGYAVLASGTAVDLNGLT
jgi:hypothetical protein